MSVHSVYSRLMTSGQIAHRPTVVLRMMECVPRNWVRTFNASLAGGGWPSTCVHPKILRRRSQHVRSGWSFGGLALPLTSQFNSFPQLFTHLLPRLVKRLLKAVEICEIRSRFRLRLLPKSGYGSLRMHTILKACRGVERR